jgi:AcrR family transcriptional regulator
MTSQECLISRYPSDMPRRKAEVRKEEILRATVSEIRARGFANTRAGDVAESLGVSTALLFYHFGTLDSLLSEAFDYAAEHDLAQLHQAVSAPANHTNRLREVLRLYAPAGRAPGWTIWIDAWAAALRVPELRKASRRLDLQWRRTVAKVIADGTEAGEFTCDDPVGAAWRITALLDGLAIQSTVHPRSISRHQLASWVFEATARELGIEPERLA